MFVLFSPLLSLGCPVFFLQDCGHPIYNKGGIIRDRGDTNKPMLAGAVEYCVYKRTRGNVKSNHAMILIRARQPTPADNYVFFLEDLPFYFECTYD